MKVKKITVEYDNGAIIHFTEEELDALQKARAVLEFIDTGANIANVLLQSMGPHTCYGHGLRDMPLFDTENPGLLPGSPFTPKKSPFDGPGKVIKKE